MSKSDTITGMNAVRPDRVKTLRETMGISQTELARRVGKKPQNIQQLEAGQVRNPQYIIELAKELETTPEYLLGKTDIAAAPAVKKIHVVKHGVYQRAPAQQPEGLSDSFVPGFRDLPVLGNAVGGPDGEFEMNGNPIDYVFRPDALQGVPGAYALYMVGTSMEPRYRAGETLFVHPGRTVRPGDFVVFQRIVHEGSPPHAFVKQFVRRDDGKYHFRQLNPQEPLSVTAGEVISIHRIILAGEG